MDTYTVDTIEDKFGKIERTTGNKKNYLGMDIEFTGDGKFYITTPQHVNKKI